MSRVLIKKTMTEGNRCVLFAYSRSTGGYIKVLQCTKRKRNSKTFHPTMLE